MEKLEEMGDISLFEKLHKAKVATTDRHKTMCEQIGTKGENWINAEYKLVLDRGSLIDFVGSKYMIYTSWKGCRITKAAFREENRGDEDLTI